VVTIDAVAYPRTRIRTVSLEDTAWLLDVDVDTLLLWVDRGVIEPIDDNISGDIEFRREDVADLLELFGA
jgi:hypothetical protein